MGALVNSEERKNERIRKGLGFPYPLRGHRRDKSAIIGEIPINTLTGRDYASILASVPEPIKETIEKERSLCASTLGDSHSYYWIRDNHFLSESAPDPDSIKSPGYLYAFIFGDYEFEFRKCTNQDEARTAAIMLAVRRGDTIRRVYRLRSHGEWKRAKGVA